VLRCAAPLHPPSTIFSLSRSRERHTTFPPSSSSSSSISRPSTSSRDLLLIPLRVAPLEPTPPWSARRRERRGVEQYRSVAHPRAPVARLRVGVAARGRRGRGRRDVVDRVEGLVLLPAAGGGAAAPPLGLGRRHHAVHHEMATMSVSLAFGLGATNRMPQYRWTRSTRIMWANVRP
jgi:hypothetical protein